MNLTRPIGFLIPLMLGLAACGPVPVDRAEQICLDDARLAAAPRGEIALGTSSGSRGSGIVGQFEMEISTDYIRQRDPSDVFNRCVLRKSGQLPSRVLADQPGWRG